MEPSVGVASEARETAPLAELVPTRAELIDAVAAERARLNVTRMRALGPYLLGLHALHALVFALLGPGPTVEITAWRRSILLAHASAVLGVGLTWAVAPTPEAARRHRPWLPKLAAGYYLTLGGVIAALDQRITTSVTPFVLASLAVALVLRLGPLPTVALQLHGFLGFVLGQAFAQPSASTRLSNEVNALSVTGLATGLAFALDRALVREVRQRLSLERQHAAIEDAYGKLRELASEASAASQAKSRFLAHVSHEIRTPMNSILGLCDLLGRELKTPKQRAWLGSIDGSCRLLKELLEDVLDLSRIEAGRLRIEPRACDVRRLVGEIVVAFEPRVAEKGLALRHAIATSVPPLLLLDEARLRQIVFNLAGNAVKFTAQGSVTIEIEASPARAGAVELLIAVRDTGPGIAEEDLGRVFEAFEQVRPGGGRGGGVGLGLAVVRGLVREMGGEVELESALGRGSSFVVRLREVAIADEAPPTLELRASLAPALPTSGRVRLDAVAPSKSSVSERKLVARRLGATLAEWRRYQRLDQAGTIAAALAALAREEGGEGLSALAAELALAVESVDVVAIERAMQALESTVEEGEGR